MRLCETCPRRTRKRDFLREVERDLETWLGEADAAVMNAEELLGQLYDTLSAAGLDPRDLSVTANFYTAVYESERDRFRLKERMMT
ncbi:MAG TPA: hypothetical protein DEP46_07195 [Blastocatellia bacterium]|nr:hypothetical protein [Blastocatellia bacterium]